MNTSRNPSKISAIQSKEEKQTILFLHRLLAMFIIETIITLELLIHTLKIQSLSYIPPLI